MSDHTFIRDLGDGLVLRRGRPEDSEALAAFNASMHSEGPDPSEPIGAWTRDLMSGGHPTFRPSDATLVEETRTGTIVSSMNLISQTWSYGGIPFGVGRPELVATLPEYRRRRLVAAQFEVIHQWSAERGERVQAITGIPWFYRQFGYEMGLELDGGRTGFPGSVPSLKEGQEEPYRFRPAADADIPLLDEVDALSRRRSLVACERPPALWRYELRGRSAVSPYCREIRVIETPAGEPVGTLLHANHVWQERLSVAHYELKPGVSWLAATPSVLRYLKATGEAYAARGEKRLFNGISFRLGTDHPVYHAIPHRLPRVDDAYAWFVRVPDVPGFLRHVAPVLERRLADSVAAGFTGELRVTFYRGGFRLFFEEGRLTVSEPWQEGSGGRALAAFPELTFLQLLFGYRTLAELEYAFADCWASADEARPLLTALFPAQPSNVWPVG